MGDHLNLLSHINRLSLLSLLNLGGLIIQTEIKIWEDYKQQKYLKVLKNPLLKDIKIWTNLFRILLYRREKLKW